MPGAKILLESPLLTAVLRGVHSALPAPPDSRSAFILPLYHPPSSYIHPPSDHRLIFKAAVALGFHAMLWFGAFCQMTPCCLTAFLSSGEEWPLSCVPHSLIESSQRLLEFVFTFSPKYTTSDGRVTSAYFCHICYVVPRLALHCPTYPLMTLLRHILLRFPFRHVFNNWSWCRAIYLIIIKISPPRSKCRHQARHGC